MVFGPHKEQIQVHLAPAIGNELLLIEYKRAYKNDSIDEYSVEKVFLI